MGSVYTFNSEYIVVETGTPGSGQLKVGVGDTLGDAIDNLESTPYQAHENPLKGILHAYKGILERDLTYDDLDPFTVKGEVEDLDDEQFEWVQRHLGVSGLRSEADTSHESAEEWYDSLGYYVADLKGNEAKYHPVCPFEEVERFSPSGSAEEALLEYARKAKETAEVVVEALEEAVEAYHQGDEASVREALRRASRLEKQYGDNPAARQLSRQLLTRPL